MGNRHFDDVHAYHQHHTLRKPDRFGFIDLLFDASPVIAKSLGLLAAAYVLAHFIIKYW